MTKAPRTGCIILAELDTFVAGDLLQQVHVGASVLLQQPNESIEQLLVRVQRSAQVLRESGCRIERASLLLGAYSADRLTDRLDLARNLLGLLTDSSAKLHLISTAEPGERDGLFELLGWLLVEARYTHRIRLTFRSSQRAARVAPSAWNSSSDADPQVFALTA